MKDVVGMEDLFAITEDGEIWSKRTNKFLKKVKSKTGYWTIPTKIGGRNGKYKTFKVHRAVAEAYIPNPNDKPFINHKDGNKLNNSVDNLEWCTASENSIHAIENGLQVPKKGEDHPSSKLTEEDVKYIKENHKPRDRKLGTRALANTLGVSHSVVSDIINNKTWKHV
jgi:hypothetical protein